MLSGIKRAGRSASEPPALWSIVFHLAYYFPYLIFAISKTLRGMFNLLIFFITDWMAISQESTSYGMSNDPRAYLCETRGHYTFHAMSPPGS